MRLLSIFICSLWLLSSSCDGYALHAIDNEPKIKLDSSLLGVWKALEDTGMGDFVYIHTYDKLPGSKNDDSEYGREMKRKAPYTYYCTILIIMARNGVMEALTHFLAR